MPTSIPVNLLNRSGEPTSGVRRRLRRSAGAAVLSAALGVTLAACGDDSDPEGGSPSRTQTASNGDVFNDADVEFASEMIQHHAQALSMVDLTAGRVLAAEVQQLAEDIRAAQGPEIETMSDWLTAWDHEIPETMRDHTNAGHDPGGDLSEQMDGMESPTDPDMPGMMSGEDLDELQHSSDAEFQDMWLEMMVEHHEGAIEMAQDEQEDGEFADAVSLAETIESAQEKEVSTMEGLLG